MSICAELLAGAQFPFDLLWNERDAISEFQAQWWARNGFSLARPTPVKDDDPRLAETIDLRTIDLEDHKCSFSEFLLKALKEGYLEGGRTLSRDIHHENVANYLLSCVPESSEKHLVLLGGGYGAGKSVTCFQLCKRGSLPIPSVAITGVDHCKFFLPEMARLQHVFDGRGSSVVQSEARAISEILFEKLLGSGKSFAWDSSLSDANAAMVRFKAAAEHGYKVTLVGCFVPVDVAVERAMKRAQASLRFPNPTHIRNSHKLFAANFLRYVDESDKVYLIDNTEDSKNSEDTARVTAEKLDRDDFLLIHDTRSFDEFIALSNA
jgi:predicted ABC-type ATPase